MGEQVLTSERVGASESTSRHHLEGVVHDGVHVAACADAVLEHLLMDACVWNEGCACVQAAAFMMGSSRVFVCVWTRMGTLSLTVSLSLSPAHHTHRSASRNRSSSPRTSSPVCVCGKESWEFRVMGRQRACVCACVHGLHA